MKILIDVILTEFNRAGYQKEEVEDVLFLKHKENHDFWICTKSFDLEHQHELFEKAINFWKQHKESEKNISVLILREVDHLSNDEIDWSIEIENDLRNMLYYFRSHRAKLWIKLLSPVSLLYRF